MGENFKDFTTIEEKTMNNVFEQLFQYGLHDTVITSIEDENFLIKLNFDEGVYLLDENGKEDVLSKPMQIVFKINSNLYESLEEAVEIVKYGRKTKYMEYSFIKKYLKKHKFGVFMVYYSNFENTVLFSGGFGREAIEFSIYGVENILVREHKSII